MSQVQTKQKRKLRDKILDYSNEGKSVVEDATVARIPMDSKSESRLGHYADTKQIITKRLTRREVITGQLAIQLGESEDIAKMVAADLRHQRLGVPRVETPKERSLREWQNLERGMDTQFGSPKPTSFWKKIEAMPEKQIVEEQFAEGEPQRNNITE